MATAEQLKSLIRSHFNDDRERFATVVLQLAAHEARQGHTALASELRDLLDKERKRRKQPQPNPLAGDLSGLMYKEESTAAKALLVIEPSLKARIERIILEFRQRGKLNSFGFRHRRKILLIGPPGTGKTLTARVLARELRLDLFTIQMDRLVTKFMGESSAKLRLVFEMIQREPAVYLFDEFDGIAGERSLENDVGEMRRVLNSFLQLVDQDTSDSLIVAATNTPRLLDQALFRRFDDVLFYEKPDESQRRELIANLLGTFKGSALQWSQLIVVSDGLSHAEIDQACRDAVKLAILTDQTQVNTESLLVAMRERQAAHRRLTE